MISKEDLFKNSDSKELFNNKVNEPIAIRMRPVTIDQFVGQKHILGPEKLLRRLIELRKLSSIILYGPSGTGKSALGFIISKIMKSNFVALHAASIGVKEVKDRLKLARLEKKKSNVSTILFVDEIHRFNKAQQDIFLDDVEKGNIILIGATTHNPFFYIVPALISRSHVFEFKPHSENELLFILKNAISDKERGFGNLKIELENGALEHICRISNGDARKALNALEVGVLSTKITKDGVINFTISVAQESIQKRIVRYDKAEDDHYDIISAFIKSMRGTDPDAALYWLAKMLYAGEDPRFIARRIVICASEDVGNADPQALVLATSAYNAVEFIGMPEARIILAQAAVYVACAPKSNASYLGIEKATNDIINKPHEEVPTHLKDASYVNADKLNRGQGYKYAHDYKNHYVKQDYKKSNTKYYIPVEHGYEKKIKMWLENLKKSEKQ